MRRKGIDHIRDVMDLASDWGVADVVISPGTRRPMISPPLQQTLGWLHESLDNLLRHAEQAGVRLLLENTPYCFRPTMNELVGVVKDVGNDNLKIVYDVANAGYIGEDPAASLVANHTAVGLLHISDTGLDEWGHDPIGTGVIDFEELGKAIEATGKMDSVVLEIIREKEPLREISTGIVELKRRGWKLNV
jgi:sugar phosphate isomerase/epimerase